MRALVYHAPKVLKVEQVPDPGLQEPRDALIRVTHTAICGSELHIYNGLIPQTRPMVLGHEFMGVIEDVGAAVTNFKKGDRVIVPFSIACGDCWFCQKGLQSQCEQSNPEKYGPEGGLLDQKGGGLYGYTDLYGGHNGGHAEAVRIPFADYCLRKVPDDLSDEQVLFLTDILPTGWWACEWAELKGGETVAVFGCGPVGLMAMKCAWIQGASRVIGLDKQEYRMEMARRVANAETVSIEEDPIETLREMTEGRGPDVCIDCVGMEADATLLEKVMDVVHVQAGDVKALKMATSAVRRGGSVSVVGVYGTTYDNFPVGQIFDKGIHLGRMGQVLVHERVDMLLGLIADGKVRADDIITHRMKLDEAPDAFAMFNAKKDDCVKVVMTP